LLSLSCTEVVPNMGGIGWSLVLGIRARAHLRKLDGRRVQLPRSGHYLFCCRTVRRSSASYTGTFTSGQYRKLRNVTLPEPHA
jgi:hypothetical protein